MLKMIQNSWKLLPVLIFMFSFSGCVTKKDLLKTFPLAPVPLSKESIIGVYGNTPVSISNKGQFVSPPAYQTLWETLNNCHSFIFKKQIPTSENATVTLSFLNNHRLKAVLDDGAIVKDSIVLKVKEYQDYVSVKKVFIIPIPFLFFHYQNTQLLISTESSNKLSVKNSRIQFVEIILAASVEEESNLIFKKIE